MSSTRARSSARRPTTDLSVLSGSKVHTVIEVSKVHTVIEADDTEDTTTDTTTTTTTTSTTTTLSPTTSTATSSATTPTNSRCSSSTPRGLLPGRGLGLGGGLRGSSKSSRPDSGIGASSSSCSASSSSEVGCGPGSALENNLADFASQAEWVATSLEMLQRVLKVRIESHDSVKSLVNAITHGSTSDQLKAHALYRWLASQSLDYYAKCTGFKSSSPTGKMKQLAEGKLCYAALYKEMARAAGLKCEKIDGYAKGPDYDPGNPIGNSSSSSSPIGNSSSNKSSSSSNNNSSSSTKHSHAHSWNAVFLEGHYHFLDAGFGAVHHKFFVEHFFMTPPDEMRLSHFPKDKRWLLMTQSLSLSDFQTTLKTWPTMFAFNIRPLNMRSVLRSYDGKLSITVFLRSVAVSPQLEYLGPGTPQDAEALAFNIDQEIRNVDSAETFHLNLPEEGTFFFTLMVHDLEEDEDIPAFQYRVEYIDELL
ncbi:hypothetical protein ACOMHN_038490 [Nucella lapillus]